MTKRKLYKIIRKNFKKILAGLGIAAVLGMFSIYQIINDLSNDSDQKTIELKQLTYEAIDLLGLKPTNATTMRWTQSGPLEITEADRNRLAQVREIIEKIKILNGDQKDLSFLMMVYLYQFGDFESLESHVFSMHSHDEKFDAITFLAMLYVNTEGLESKGFSFIEKALKVSPEDIGLKMIYGMLLHSQNRNQESIKSFKQALVLAPFHDEVVYQLIHVYLETGNMSEAKSLLHEYHQSGRESFFTYHAMGEISHYEKRYSDAIEFYDKGLALYPQSTLIHNSLGHVYSLIGNEKLAKEHKTLAKLYLHDSSYPERSTEYGNSNYFMKVYGESVLRDKNPN